MQAKTRSAPRTPSPCRRSIQSPTRFGSSRRTSAQSPIGASSGARAADEVNAGGEGGGTRGRADACAISVAIGHEPVIVQPRGSSRKAAPPSPRSSCGRRRRSRCHPPQHPAPFREGIGHRSPRKSRLSFGRPSNFLASSCTASRLFGVRSLWDRRDRKAVDVLEARASARRKRSQTDRRRGSRRNRAGR